MASEGEGQTMVKIPRKGRQEFSFIRSELFHQMLMEDFQFLDAARTFVGNFEPPTLNYSDINSKENFRKASLAYPNGLIEFDHFTHRTPSRIFSNLNMNPDIRSLKFQARSSIWPPLSIWAHWLLHTTFYSILMVIVITVNSVTIAVDQEMGNEEEAQDIRRFLEALDFFFLCLFVSEILLKFLDDFGNFWGEGWNIFDFIITATSLAAPVLDLSYPDQEQEDLEQVLTAVKYLRIIRIFRSLNVVTRIHKIQLIWGAVVKTFTAMIYITALMSIFFYIFAIIGIQLFDRFTHSHLPHLKYRGAFANLYNAFVTLFQIFTLDQWYDVIADTAEVMGFPVACGYILIWVLLGSFIFRNIFVGVMVNNFQNIRQSLIQDGEDEEGMSGGTKDTMDIFILDQLENEGNLSDDVLVDWEAEIFHSIELIRSIGHKMSPVFWPRDTMFQYYILLEAYASNLDERDHLMHLLDKAMLHFMDP